MNDVWLGILGAAAGVPELPGARCRGRWEIFDAIHDPAAVAVATALCNRCPALIQCTEYANANKTKLHGIVAGRVFNKGKKNGRRVA